ncbi:RES domain-containing protein [uncultured Nocardioides sp.]|uniref:RES domain-containing protein n=1 Tax=uncultured Nocardioides sp. TaxID=198441 RepID=UPI0034501107
MRTGFRHADPRQGFLWETADQPAARWHATGEGPAHYLADTPDGAWAEFLRHEHITDPDDLEGVARSLWAIVVDDADVEDATALTLPADLSFAGYGDCQAAARSARAAGATAVRAPSAALQPGHAGGYVCDGGLQPAPPTDGEVWVLFGPRNDIRGWRCVQAGSPSADLLTAVRHL